VDPGRLGLDRRLAGCIVAGAVSRVPVLARRFEKFEPTAVFGLIARHQVKNIFFPPTALKILRTVADPKNNGNTTCARWPAAVKVSVMN